MLSFQVSRVPDHHSMESRVQTTGAQGQDVLLELMDTGHNAQGGDKMIWLAGHCSSGFSLPWLAVTSAFSTDDESLAQSYQQSCMFCRVTRARRAAGADGRYTQCARATATYTSQPDPKPSNACCPMASWSFRRFCAAACTPPSQQPPSCHSRYG